MSMSKERSFGEELRAFRERKKMSQLKLAQAVGVNRQTIVAWELSKNPPRDRTRVLELARVLDLDERDTNILLAAAFLTLLPPWHVPYHRNPLFTGREEVLQEMQRMLPTGTTVAVTQSRAISGLGGIGKTQTALEYAYRYRDDYSAVFWLQADSREILSLACVQLAQELGLPEGNEADQTRAVAALKRWLKSKTKWLLILDNVEDLQILEEFLPPGHHGCVLLTTRITVTEPIAYASELEKMTEQEAVLFLLRRTKLLALDASINQASKEHYVLAKKIWELMDGLPLALDQAGAYIIETGCGISNYLDRYSSQRIKLLQRRGKLVTAHPEPVTMTWLLSFEKIEQTNPAAAELLRLCAFLHSDAIPEEFITEGSAYLSPKLQALSSDLVALDEAMEVLHCYSMIRRDANMGTFSIHRLVQTVLRDEMPEDLQHQWTERAVQVVSYHFLHPSKVAAWPFCERYIAHVQTCADHMKDMNMIPREAPDLLNQAGKYLIERARYAAAELLLMKARELHIQWLGPHHPDTAVSLHNLATLYMYQNKQVEAEKLYKQALTIREQQPDTHHLDIATSLDSLGLLYENQERYSEAETFYQRAMAIREQQLNSSDPLIAESLSSIARLRAAQGKYKEAEQLHQRALSIREKQLGSFDPVVAVSLNSLGTLYQKQKEYVNAEQYFQHALTINEKKFGHLHLYVVANLNNLASLFFDQGKYTEAEQCFKRAMAINEQILEPHHPLTQNILAGLILLYRELNKYVEVEQLYLRDLKLKEDYYGLEHLYTANSIYNLATLYLEQGRYVEAEPLYQRALAIRMQLLNENHLDIASNLYLLAHANRGLGKYLEAKQHFRQALRIYQNVLNPDDMCIKMVTEALNDI